MLNYIKILLVIAVSLFLVNTAVAGSDWKIKIKVSGGGTYGYAVAGVKQGATDERDNAFDLFTMMDNLNTNYIFSYFPHPEWGHQFVNYSEDIKAPGPIKEWFLEIDSNISGQLTITWPDLYENIGPYEALLIDQALTGNEIDMQTDASFVFDNRPGTPRQFLIRIIAPAGTYEPTLFFTQKDHRINLTWNELGDPALISGYDVYRRIAGGEYQKINTSLLKKKTYNESVSELLHKGGKLTLYYKVATIGLEPGGDILRFSNEVKVDVLF